MRKEVTIKIRFVEGNIASIVHTEGFEDNALDQMAIIGALENAKQQELDKLKNVFKTQL